MDGVVELSPFVWGDAMIEDEGSVGRGEDHEEENQEEAACRPPKRWTSERMRRIMQRESMK